MAYTLQAIVGREEEMRRVAPAELTTIALKNGFAIWPLDSGYQEFHDMPFLPLTDEGSADVPRMVVEVAGLLDECAYIEAEFCGGSGVQASVLYRYGCQIGQPNESETAINDALRSLGFESEPSLDEFDSIGLGRERHTDAWVNHKA